MALRSFGRMFGRATDDHPWMVALHGWGRRGSDFDVMVEGAEAVAFDLPGFGASPPPDAAVGASWYADEVVAALEDLEGPFVVVGHSFGGRVGVELAVKRPDLVKGLVLSGVPLLRLHPPSRPPLGYRLVKWAARWRLVPAARLERERRRRGSADYRAAEGVMRDVLVTTVNESYETQLAALRCPVRLVWGAQDTDVPVAVAEHAARILESTGVDVRLEVVPATGHLTPIEAPDRLRAAAESLR